MEKSATPLNKALQKQAKKLEKNLHKIGEHGAVGFVTKNGWICAECGKFEKLNN